MGKNPKCIPHPPQFLSLGTPVFEGKIKIYFVPKAERNMIFLPLSGKGIRCRLSVMDAGPRMLPLLCSSHQGFPAPCSLLPSSKKPHSNIAPPVTTSSPSKDFHHRQENFHHPQNFHRRCQDCHNNLDSRILAFVFPLVAFHLVHCCTPSLC